MENQRILLADDDPMVVRALRRVAESGPYEIVEVKNGADVLPKAEEIKPDLIVLDMGFPDADGRDILAQLKQDARTSEIPVLVWSGRDMDSDRRISLALGAEDYVEKTEAGPLISKIRRV